MEGTAYFLLKCLQSNKQNSSALLSLFLWPVLNEKEIGGKAHSVDLDQIEWKKVSDERLKTKKILAPLTHRYLTFVLQGC